MRMIVTTFLMISASVTFGQELALNDIEIDKPHIMVDEPAKLSGGIHEYISKEINYPEEARQNNISGRVFVQYIVEKDGSLSNFEVVKKVGFGCDKEALRIFKNMPKWTPGKIDGEPVRQKMIFYAYFNPELLNKSE